MAEPGTRSLFRRGVALEAAGWRSLFRWVTRAPLAPEGSRAFAHHAPVLPLVWVFIVVSGVELVAVDFLLHRWPIPRIAFGVLGVWGLAFMFGYLANLRTNRHLVGDGGIRVRQVEVDLAIDWDDVLTVAERSHLYPDSTTVRLTGEGSVQELAIAVQCRTNIEIRLNRPVAVSLPQRDAVVSSVNLWTDDPRGFAGLAAQELASRAR